MRQRAGLLRNRITIQTATASTNAFGEVERAWSSTAIGNVWAQVETEDGIERLQSGAERTRAAATFRVRYRTDIDERSNRLLWPAGSTSAVWDIESVVDLDGANTITQITAVKHG